MYCVIDDDDHIIIALHDDPVICCNLAWLHNCCQTASIHVIPVTGPIAFNDLSDSCLTALVAKFEAPETMRYKRLIQLYTQILAIKPIVVNKFLLDMQCANRKDDGFVYKYQADSSKPKKV